MPALGVRAGIAGTLRSEFTKIRSARSTYWSLILLVLAGFAWTVADCLGTAHNWPHMAAQDKIGFDATQASVTGVALLGHLVILVLGSGGAAGRVTRRSRLPAEGPGGGRQRLHRGRRQRGARRYRARLRSGQAASRRRPARRFAGLAHRAGA